MVTLVSASWQISPRRDFATCLPLALAATLMPWGGGVGRRSMTDGAAERAVRVLRAANRLADAAGMIGELGPYGVPDGPDGTTSLGAAVLEAYGDQLAAAGVLAAAETAWLDAAADQRSFAAAATSGGEGIARMAEADRIDAKRRR